MLPDWARGRLDKIISDAETSVRAPQRAFAFPSIRPYLRGGMAGRQLLIGFGVLARLLWNALVKALRAATAKEAPAKADKRAAGKGEKPADKDRGAKPEAKATAFADEVEKFAVAGFCVLVAVTVGGGALAAIGPRLTPYLPVIGYVGVPLLMVVAWIAAPYAPKKKAQGAADGAPATPAEVPLPEVARDEFVALIHDVLGTLSGAHLSTLTTALTVRAGGPWQIPDVRALCETHGVPVRPAVRGLQKRVSPGVHRDDLPPLPRPLPEGVRSSPGTVVIAGREATTAPTTDPPTTPAAAATDRRTGGVRVVSVDDPGNPSRTHVTVIPASRKRA